MTRSAKHRRASRKYAIAVLLVVVIAGVLAGYVLLQQPKTARIVIAGVTLVVEVADTSSARQKGLSSRDYMSPDHGMLFVFESEDYWGFWMKDMKFQLDFIWFSSDRRIVSVAENLQPCEVQNCPVYLPPTKAMYVLEVNAGFVQRYNIFLGDTFSFLS